MGIETSNNFDLVNQQNSKEPVIVLEIEELSYYFSSAKIYSKIRYDDPDTYYEGVYIYDGLRPLGNDKQKKHIAKNCIDTKYEGLWLCERY